jgi:hypothetical protein
MSERGSGQFVPERVMSLEDVFLSHEFGRVRRSASPTGSGFPGPRDAGPLVPPRPAPGPDRHASTTHRRRSRAMRAASGVAAALVVALGLVTSTGRVSRTGSSDARSGSAPPSVGVRGGSRAGAPSAGGEPTALSTAAAPSTTESVPGSPGRVADLTVSQRADPEQTPAGAPESPTAASGPTPTPTPSPSPNPSPTSSPAPVPTGTSPATPSPTPSPAVAPVAPSSSPSPPSPSAPSSTSAPSPSPAPSDAPAPAGVLLDTVVAATDAAVAGAVATLSSTAPAVTSVLGSLSLPSDTSG